MDRITEIPPCQCGMTTKPNDDCVCLVKRT